MSANEKRPHSEVFPVAQHIVEKLAPHCERIEVAGSLRRGREMVGDIEIVLLPRPVTNLVGDAIGTEVDRFLAEHGVELSKNGDRYKQFRYGVYVVELWIPASRAHWGSIFQIRTGSHDFNMWVQQTAAPAAGVKFRKGRIYHHGALLETPEEADVLDALGLPWIPPQHRDDGKWVEYVR